MAAYYSTLATVSGSAKAGSGKLFSFKAVNRNASVRYLQLFDVAAPSPGAGAVPLDEFLVPQQGMLVVGTDFYTDSGTSFSNGICWGFSTSSGTYTAATAADCDFSAVFA